MWAHARAYVSMCVTTRILLHQAFSPRGVKFARSHQHVQMRCFDIFIYIGFMYIICPAVCCLTKAKYAPKLQILFCLIKKAFTLNVLCQCVGFIPLHSWTHKAFLHSWFPVQKRRRKTSVIYSPFLDQQPQNPSSVWIWEEILNKYACARNSEQMDVSCLLVSGVRLLVCVQTRDVQVGVIARYWFNTGWKAISALVHSQPRALSSDRRSACILHMLVVPAKCMLTWRRNATVFLQWSDYRQYLRVNS